MPTLPLYMPTDIPGASRRVFAPGGYEWWRFDGQSAAGDVRFVAIVGVGAPESPDYLRRYARYCRRPTSYPPPLPAEYPFAQFKLSCSARPAVELTTYYPAGQFSPSVKPLLVRVGPNTIHRDEDGTFALRLDLIKSVGNSLLARLAFRRRGQTGAGHAPLADPDLEMGHYRTLVAPSCDIEGTIEWPARLSDRPRIEIQGRGHLGYEFGTAPQPRAGMARLQRRLA